MENLSDNIKILKSQANCTLDDDMAISLLAKFDNDVVSHYTCKKCESFVEQHCNQTLTKRESHVKRYCIFC